MKLELDHPVDAGNSKYVNEVLGLSEITIDGLAMDDESVDWDRLLKRHKIFRDPVHGDFWISELETKILDTRVFQRLRGIRQLGLTYLVYPAAQHTRFEHSLGALYISQLIIFSIDRNWQDKENILGRTEDDLEKKGLEIFTVSSRDKVLIRLAALMHDIAHIPFGHTLEKEGNIFEKSQWSDQIRMKKYFDDFYKDIIYNYLNVMKIPEKNIFPLIKELKNVLLAIEGSSLDGKGTIVKEKDDDAAKTKLKFPFIADIVGDTICADLLDYLARDSYFTGFKLAYDPRVIKNFVLIGESGKKETARLVLLFIRKGKARSDTISSAMRLLWQRFYLAEAIYYHRVKTAASAMIINSIYAALRNDSYLFNLSLDYNEEIDNAKRLNKPSDRLKEEFIKNGYQPIVNPEGKFIVDHSNEGIDKICTYPRTFYVEKKDNLNIYGSLITMGDLMDLDDEDLLFRLEQIINKSKILDYNREVIKNTIEKIRSRYMYKPIFLSSSSTDETSNTYRKQKKCIEEYTNPENRWHAQRELEKILGLPAGTIIIYTSKKDEGKDAATKVLSGNGSDIEIGALSNLDSDGAIGKEIDALQTKYKKLWRLYVFLDKGYIDKNINQISQEKWGQLLSGYFKYNFQLNNEIEDDLISKAKERTLNDAFIEVYHPTTPDNLKSKFSEMKIAARGGFEMNNLSKDTLEVAYERMMKEEGH